ncbi:MAG: hypothetical protein HYX80_10395 [Chloroflexi bacterium]|nr:hypothetical protein [Chloroflexota bacterium]
MTASERKVEGWIDDIVGALFDPIIVTPGGWGDDLPEWLKTRVTLERLAENIVATREGREITATDAEAACYLFTASLTAPIGGDWTQIYLYVAGGELKDKMPEDIKVESLTESQWRDLKELKNWIYRQRVKHRKEKAHGERRETKGEANTKELETRPIQPTFF